MTLSEKVELLMKKKGGGLSISAFLPEWRRGVSYSLPFSALTGKVPDIQYILVKGSEWGLGI